MVHVMKRPLVSYFPERFTEPAIFGKMVDAPWMEYYSTDDLVGIGVAYIDGRSGIKAAAHFVDACCVEGVLDEELLASILWSLYGRNWQRLWDAYMAEYNPLENYKVKEVIERKKNEKANIDRSIDESVDSSVDSTNTLNGNTTTETKGTVSLDGKEVTNTTDDTTSTVTYGKTTSTEGETDVYTHAFNSPTKVPTQVEEETGKEVLGGSDRTVTNDVVQSTATRDDTTTTDTSVGTTVGNTEKQNSTSTTADITKDNTAEERGEQEETIRDKGGNIGQNTYQELLKQEMELWSWSFFDRVFADCDKYLTLPYVCYVDDGTNAVVGTAIAGTAIVGRGCYHGI